MQGGLANVLHIEVAVLSKISPDLVMYWPKFAWVSWGLGPNKSKAMNKHKKYTFKLYFAKWIGIVTFGLHCTA